MRHRSIMAVGALVLIGAAGACAKSDRPADSVATTTTSGGDVGAGVSTQTTIPLDSTSAISSTNTMGATPLPSDTTKKPTNTP